MHRTPERSITRQSRRWDEAMARARQGSEKIRTHDHKRKICSRHSTINSDFKYIGKLRGDCKALTITKFGTWVEADNSEAQQNEL